MTHSRIKGEGISRSLWKDLAKGIKADSEDAIVVLWAPEIDAATAAREVISRAREALEGIPSETRQAHGDCTNGFERILPGPDRMYPDTDTPPLPIPDTMVLEVRGNLAEPPWARATRYEGLGLDPRAAKALSVASWADLFDEVDPEKGEPARRFALVLEKRIPFHTRRRLGSKPRTPKGIPEASRLAPLVRAMERGEIRSEALAWAVDESISAPEKSTEAVLSKFRPRPDDPERLEEMLEDLIYRAQEGRERSKQTFINWAMGEVMRTFLGRVDPSAVQARLAQGFPVRNTREVES
jgi:glutamyl-tRNA(Gln) amidotransferase subunit E